MKKILALAMVALLMTAGAALAAPRGMEFITPNATFPAGSPSTTNNDDSCDISNQPAATLLLPVFEVDFNSPANTATNTIFTITNTSAIPQIAHITLWTDWSFPVLDFNVFLTGYDVQGLSLYDIIARGVLPGGGNQVVRGPRSASNITGNPNFSDTAAARCLNLPTQIPTSLLNDIRTALTTGRTSGCTGFVGSANSVATGYVTIDVGNTCSQTLPTDPNYYINEILFDNVLIGDYQRINPTSTTGNYAGGESLVPIRAIPEGGRAEIVQPTNLPYTFYDRYTPTGLRSADRRQPLPARFAARYIEGGTGAFNTDFLVWREGVTRGSAGCAVSANGALGITEIVRFDERENPSTTAGPPAISPAPPQVASLPEAVVVPTTDSVFPPGLTSGDVGGWMYLNLHNGGSTAYSSPGRPSQNWVVVSLTAEGRFGVDFDAAHLGNGCSPPVAAAVTIGPSPNQTPVGF